MEYNNNKKICFVDALKEIWYKYRLIIILLVCFILTLIVILATRGKTSTNGKYKDIERIMIINAQNYIKNNNIKDNYYVSLNNLNIKIDDELKCDSLSGVYKSDDTYYPYLLCDSYVSNPIEEILEKNENNKEYGMLKGSNPLIVHQSSYQEEGIESKYEVTIKGDDIDNGINIVTYYLNENGKNLGELKRIVLADEIEGSYPVLTLYGDKARTIPKGSVYKDQGYNVLDERDGNITDKVVVKGKVNVNEVGTYKLTYSVTNSRGKTVTADRTIIVNESDISLNITHTIDPNTITKKSVTMKVVINGSGYKYSILPDNSKKEGNELTYTVYKNGTYDFIIYDTNNNSEVYSVKISNINTDPPKGTCVVTYEKGKSTMKITPEEPDYIKQYDIYHNNKLLTTQKEATYVYNEYPIEPKVKLVDTFNKSRIIDCKVDMKGKIYAGVNYNNFTWKYYSPGSGPAANYYKNTISYAIWAPDDIKDLNGIKLPIMVWLHGSAETYDKVRKPDVYLNRGFPKMVSNWKLEPIPAIIIAPQAPSVKECCYSYRIYESIRAMVSYVKDKYNSPTNSIAIVGHSMGGGGALLINDNMKNYFRTVVPLSPGYGIIGSKQTYENVRIKGFDEDCQTEKLFIWMGRPEAFTCLRGMDNVEAFEYSMTLDSNGDGVSDLIEWMFEEYYNNYAQNAK